MLLDVLKNTLRRIYKVARWSTEHGRRWSTEHGRRWSYTEQTIARKVSKLDPFTLYML